MIMENLWFLLPKSLVSPLGGFLVGFPLPPNWRPGAGAEPGLLTHPPGGWFGVHPCAFGTWLPTDLCIGT